MAKETAAKHEILQADINRIKDDIKEINQKLDIKFVSHETFKITVDALNQSITTVVKIAVFLFIPVYAAVVALVFKSFTQ